MTVVSLQPAHLPDLMQLKDAAGWNQIDEDWLRCIRLQPDGCVGITTEDKVIATATAINYDEDLSWIGMVLTSPEYRGQGLARKLMEFLLARSTAARVGLDASDMGKPLYSSLGFVDECAIERWVRQPEAAPGRSLPPAQAYLAADREVFGADRSALLEELGKHDSARSNSGYAFARPGSKYQYLGPWIAETQEDARELLLWFLGRYGSHATCIDLFPHHKDVVSLVSEYGFAPVRRLTRMVLAPASPQLPDPRTYGIAGFEFG